MALRTVVSSRIPMVIILGATGTGKTKLSLELAQKFGAEIISADSMQTYKGLDIVTAKVTPQEREKTPHHLLDILEPHQIFTVVDFRNRALKIIETLTEQGKIPLIAGGSIYYIESIVYNILIEGSKYYDGLLWDVSRRKRDYPDLEHNEEVEAKRTQTGNNKDHIQASTSDKKETDGSPTADECSTTEKGLETNGKIETITKEQLQKDFDLEYTFTSNQFHEKLKAIDPVMAERLHPNNRRKILRSIEVWLKTGKTHSEHLRMQNEIEGQLRRPGSTIILWLKCEQNVLHERLDKRVDSMLEEGLIKELLDFHAKHNKQRIQDGKPPDYTKGVFQTLGFKEFHDYLMLSEEERNSEMGQDLLQKNIECMKLSTRRYARRQIKMIRGRFLEHPAREIAPIYELDTTDLTQWDDLVTNKAIHIIESHLNGTPCDYAPITVPTKEEKRKIDGNSYNYCEVCNRVMIGDNVYEIHLKSVRHMRVLKKKKQVQSSDADENSE